MQLELFHFASGTVAAIVAHAVDEVSGHQAARLVRTENTEATVNAFEKRRIRQSRPPKRLAVDEGCACCNEDFAKALSSSSRPANPRTRSA